MRVRFAEPQGTNTLVLSRRDRSNMNTFERQLPATCDAPSLARSWIRTALQMWKLDRLGDVTDLLASELVANVVEHVREPMSLRVSRRHESIRVEVDDVSPSFPALRRSGPADEQGRGVLLVDTLSDRWGTIGHPGDGKTVWFELDATPVS